MKKNLKKILLGILGKKIAGSLDYLTFGKNEPALHHYHNTYREALGLQSLPLEEA